jgi:hypothetical protein
MKEIKDDWVFRGRQLPDTAASVAGYARLIQHYKLNVPLPHKLCFISHKHQRYETDHWIAFTPRHAPDDSISGDLTFALRYEGLDLGILKALFAKINPEIIARWIRLEPTGSYSRRVWFLYEWLTGKVLDEPDVLTGNYVDALNDKLQFGTHTTVPSRRYRVNNNLPGTPSFCPLVRRTKKLEDLMSATHSALKKARKNGTNPRHNLRASTLLALRDNQASLALNNNNIVRNKADSMDEIQERWIAITRQSLKAPLTLDELLRLQSMMIMDHRFVSPGFRQKDTYQGDYDPVCQKSLPMHIHARSQDLSYLLEGWVKTYQLLKEQGIDPVLLATSLAFGWAFIHPFSDGNGRIQRYVIQYILEQFDFMPKGLIFPISLVILNRMEEYVQAVQSYSLSYLHLISWHPTHQRDIEVTNETKDLYSYFDATIQAEFLYDCVQEIIEAIIPAEISYIEQHDRLKEALKKKVDMPNALYDSLIDILHQNEGRLSGKVLGKTFEKLTETECREIEALYREISTNTSSFLNTFQFETTSSLEKEL